MGRSTPALLCELHAHTTWSDGALSIRELVDLYGLAGFDVLAVTDHVVRPGEVHVRAIREATYDGYLEELEAEGERALAHYGLLVVPGLELTYDDSDPRLGAHALALGVRRFIGLEQGLEPALAEAKSVGAALVAAHPYTVAGTKSAHRTTARFAEEPEWAAEAVHRFELCNRHDFFEWVARAQLPVVANGDFHRPEHLATWKTLIPAERTQDAVLDYLRSRDPVALTPFRPPAEAIRRAA
jgi:predicted metal-dependent phosphoesterase TrpH